MPIGYLITVALVTLVTIAALTPLRRPFAVGDLSYRFGYLANELPFLLLYWLIAWSVLAVAEGDVRGKLGRVAVGLCGLTVLGLLLVVRRGLRAGPVLDRALDAGLGPQWQRAIAPPLAAGLRRGLPIGLILLAPFLMRRMDVKRVRSIRYGDAGDQQTLDIYRPRAAKTGCPVLLHLHGGNFVTGRKSHEARPLLTRLASAGWVCVSANYRLAPGAPFPAQLVDVKRVIAWLRQHGSKYGADPALLVVCGSSSGGQLAALAGLTQNDNRFQPGFADADTSISAVISLYGFYGREAGVASPLSYLTAQAPPFLLVHGDRDTMILVEGARVFADRLRAVSAKPVVYAELPGGQHNFDLFHSVRFEAVVNAAERFATWVRCTAELQPRYPA